MFPQLWSYLILSLLMRWVILLFPFYRWEKVEPEVWPQRRCIPHYWYQRAFCSQLDFYQYPFRKITSFSLPLSTQAFNPSKPSMCPPSRKFTPSLPTVYTGLPFSQSPAPLPLGAHIHCMTWCFGGSATWREGGQSGWGAVPEFRCLPSLSMWFWATDIPSLGLHWAPL